MTLRLGPKLDAYIALAAGGLLAALLLGRAELAVLALPFALVAVAGMASTRRPVLDVEAELQRDRLIEGEETGLCVTIGALAPGPDAEVELELTLPAGLELASGDRTQSVRVRAGVPARCVFTIRARNWGGYAVPGPRVRMWDGLGFFVAEQPVGAPLPLRVYPAPQLLKSVLAPLETQDGAGNFVSRRRGDGIEFADVRQFQPGDRVRQINWRATARRGQLHVNQHHLERNSDVVIFLDTFAAVGAAGSTTLDLAVRGAATFAEGYLRQRDRVGMIGFGGILRWLRPGLGMIQLYRLLDSLLDTQVVSSYAWKGIDVIPAGTLPPKALLVALTPLLDERTIAALLDVRGRGFDVAVVELDPTPLVSPRRDELGHLALRLWRLRRESLRERFRRAGIPIAAWTSERPLEAVLEEVRGFRRRNAFARG